MARAPADAATIRRRQEAVEELRGNVDLRESSPSSMPRCTRIWIRTVSSPGRRNRPGR